MAPKLLTLTTFAVTDTDPAGIALTLKGAANLIPATIPSEKGTRGTRVVTIPSDDSDSLYAIAERVKVNGVTEVDDADADYFAWFRDNFVPAANGGGAADVAEAEAEAEADPEAEPEPVADDEAELEARAQAARAELEAAEDSASSVDRKGLLSRMKANEIKAEAKRIGVKPGTTKEATIDAILAHENRHATALKSVKAAKTFIADHSENEAELQALLDAETAGKARKSIIDAAQAAIDALTPEPEPEPEPEAEPEVRRASGLPDEVRQEAEVLIAGMSDIVGQLVKLVGHRRAQTAMRRLVGGVSEDGEVNMEVILGGTSQRKSPICHVSGVRHTVTKRHRDARGTCTYTVECLEGGGYKLVGLEGARTDVKVGDTFKHGLELVSTLTGRDIGIPTVARWFCLT